MEKGIPRAVRRRGLRFVRIKPKEKVPLDPEWQKTGNFSWGDPSLTEWIQGGGNLGILTGNGLIIIDCDTIEAERLAEQLPKTFVVGTSVTASGFRKKHYYFLCPLETKIILKDHDKHLGEIQAKGQQCLIPPSVHPSGAMYEVLQDRPIASLDEKDLLKTISPFVTGGLGQVSAGAVRLKIGEKLTEGSRNDRLFRLACSMRSSGAEEEEIMAALAALNKARCSPALPDHELSRIVESAGKYPVKKQAEAGGFFENMNGKKKFEPGVLADFIKEKTTFKTLIGSREMYYYVDGIYRTGAREYIQNVCFELLGQEYRQVFFKEVISSIEASSYIEPSAIDSGFINFKNGLLNPLTREWITHTPDIFSVNRVPIEYDPEATCPIFEEQLSKKLDDPDMIKTVQEMFGYVYLPGQKYEKAFLLFGPSKTMKSTTLKVLELMIGDDLRTSFSLQQITDESFTDGYLYGKIANIYSDLDDKAIKRTTKFMTIVGGDSITGQRKYQDPISFRPSAKLIFSCNEIPSGRRDEAYYRRWILIPFGKVTDSKKIDPGMIDKFKKELPGVINWSLRGLDRLLEKECFSDPKTVNEIRELYEKNSSTVDVFIVKFIEDDYDARILKRDIYTAYVNFCDVENVKKKEPHVFGRLFVQITGCGQSKIDGIPAYKGVRLIKGGIVKQGKLDSLAKN